MENILDDYRKDYELEQEQEWRLFIGPKANFYVPKWIAIQQGSMVSFNLAAFLVGLLWLLYRKMYLECGILAFIIVVETLISEYYFLPQFTNYTQQATYNIIINLMYGLALGLFGNLLYYNNAQRKIKKLRAQGMAEEKYEKALQATGGVALLPVIILLFVVLFLYVFINSI